MSLLVSLEPTQLTSFLALPEYQIAKVTLRDAIIATQREWEIPGTSVIATCWDTSGSNSGKHIGAAKLYDVSKRNTHLWLSCRHHIDEWHVTHANFAARNIATAPEDTLYSTKRCSVACLWIT